MAGKYAEVGLVEKINLKGTDASYYTVKGGVSIKLPEGAEAEITKVTPIPAGTPGLGDVTPGTTLENVPTDAIENLFAPIEGTVTWKETC